MTISVPDVKLGVSEQRDRWHSMIQWQLFNTTIPWFSSVFLLCIVFHVLRDFKSFIIFDSIAHCHQFVFSLELGRAGLFGARGHCEEFVTMRCMKFHPTVGLGHTGYERRDRRHVGQLRSGALKLSQCSPNGSVSVPNQVASCCIQQ